MTAGTSARGMPAATRPAYRDWEADRVTASVALSVQFPVPGTVGVGQDRS